MSRVLFEALSHKKNAPLLIYTADGTSPKEIDDGVAVKALDTNHEQYRVAVCVADTSRLYLDGDVRKQALANVHAEYWDLPNGERGYDPMIPIAKIVGKELIKDKVRDALLVSFTVGTKRPPTDIAVTFGKVIAAKNYHYNELPRITGNYKTATHFAAASNLILKHLRYTAGGDASGRSKAGESVQDLSYKKWLKGARMNEAFMIAANHLVGKLMQAEGLPAIYRVHDITASAHQEFIEANCAWYQRAPGVHQGLGIDPYCRVTSPLRRLEDFIMSYHLRLRAEGSKPTKADENLMDTAIRALNKRAIFESVLGSSAVRAKQARIDAINDAARFAENKAG